MTTLHGKLRISTLLIPLSLALAASAASEPRASSSADPEAKRAVTAARLLVPFFEVDLTDPGGATTLFSVRNETLQAVDVRISVFAPDSPQSPFHSEVVTLAGKQLRSIDVRALLAGETGVVTGYVVAETVDGGAVIQGEYFQIKPTEDFANGSRLVNVDRESQDNDLCSVFSIRFLNGGPFSGGTVFTFWLDLDVAPQGTDVITYAIYNEGGELIFFANLPANEVVFQVSAEELTALGPTSFGVIEIQLNGGVLGHVSAVMSALGRYSVGLEAACRD